MNYIEEIASIKVNKTGNQISLHKPLLLLLVIAETLKGHKNRFFFREIEPQLESLLQNFGLKNTKRINPQYPFIYLSSSSNLWQCSVDKNSLKNPDAASRKELLHAEGELNDQFYTYLSQEQNAMNVISYILNEYWTEAYHVDIIEHLGIQLDFEENHEKTRSKNKRSKQFVEEVLDAYERKCAVCEQSIRLRDTLLGIDACHIRPIQHNGEDLITNGVALCKLHHWAFDRGAISISQDSKVLVSQKLNGFKVQEFFQRYRDIDIFKPNNTTTHPKLENLKYHNKFIYLK